jgi:hypothetical protein
MRLAAIFALSATLGCAGPEPDAGSTAEGHTHSGTVVLVLHPKNRQELALSIEAGNLTLEPARKGLPSQQWQVWKGKYFTWSILHSISADKFIGVPDRPSDGIVATLYNDTQISNEIYVEIIDKATRTTVNDFTNGQQVVIKDSNVGNDYDSMLFLTLDEPSGSSRKASILFRTYKGEFSAIPDDRIWIVEKIDTTSNNSRTILR